MSKQKAKDILALSSHGHGDTKAQPSTTSTKPEKQPKAILHKGKVLDYNVIYEGAEVTPKPLNPQIYKGGRERQLSIVNISGTETSTTKLNVNVFKSSSGGKFRTDTKNMEFNKSYMAQTTAGGMSSYIETVMNDEDNTTESERAVSIETPSSEAMRVPVPEIVSKIPDQVCLTLNESDTIFLLDLPSSTVPKDSEEGNEVEEYNKNYEYLTTGKGRNRKVITNYVQTIAILQKSRDTDAIRIKTARNSTFASNWEMYDTLEKEKEEALRIERHLERGDTLSHDLNDTFSVDSLRQSTEEKQMLKLLHNYKFHKAVSIIERLLANNCYNKEQKLFKNLSDFDFYRDNIEYKYRLHLLWTFSNALTQGKCASCLHWNPANENILAIGYGKFLYSERATGYVLIWNIKNPVQPERVYHFPEPVTAVKFSTSDPHRLAVGFYNGDINVIDIRSINLYLINETSHKDSQSFEVVNYLTFYTGDEHCNFEEQILACFGDGRVCKYRITALKYLFCTQIMRVTESDGTIRGIKKMTMVNNSPVPLAKYIGAQSIEMHPSDPNLYFVTTSSGVIQNCSMNYFNQHLDLLSVHDGPAYTMKFSPFCEKLYVTCGGDWYIRIWAETITEPLLEILTVMNPVQSVIWSPTHSTVLVSIQANDIHIWDLQRKIYYPQNTIKSPTNSRNVNCTFTNNGKCLVVTDIEGHAHVFSLEDMPIPAFFQDELLHSAMCNALITKPLILRKFKNLIKAKSDNSIDH